MTIMSTMIGQRIRTRREALGLTQDDLAARIGVTRSAVSQWESATIGTILGPNLVACAKALGTTADELLSGKIRGTQEEPAAYAVAMPEMLAAIWPNLTQAQQEALVHQAAEQAQSNAAILAELTKKP